MQATQCNTVPGATNPRVRLATNPRVTEQYIARTKLSCIHLADIAARAHSLPMQHQLLYYGHGMRYCNTTEITVSVVVGLYNTAM